MVISAGRRAVILSPELNKCIIFQYLPYLKTQIVGRTLEIFILKVFPTLEAI